MIVVMVPVARTMALGIMVCGRSMVALAICSRGVKGARSSAREASGVARATCHEVGKIVDE